MQFDMKLMRPDLTLRTAAGPGGVGRALMVFCGVVLCLSAFGLWLMPAALEADGATVIRAALTSVFIGIGFSLFSKGRAPRQHDEVELDLRTAELRHLQRNDNGVARVTARYRLADLSFFDVVGGDIVARCRNGQEVLRMALPVQGASEALKGLLHQHRKAA